MHDNITFEKYIFYSVDHNFWRENNFFWEHSLLGYVIKQKPDFYWQLKAWSN